MTSALQLFATGLLASLIALAAPAPLAAQAPGGSGQQAAEVASMVDLALTEYADAVRDGEIVNEMEYAESLEFTSQAAELFEKLREDGPGADAHADAGAGGPEAGAGGADGSGADGSGADDDGADDGGADDDGSDAPGPEAGAGSDVAATVAARLDSLNALVEAKGPVSRYRELAERVTDALARHWGAVSVSTPDRRPSAAHGARLYRQACAACHGRAGRGDGWAARGMSPAPPDLTAPVRHAEATPGRDYQVILYGIPETAMPAHRDWLSVEETWDLVAYLQTLRHGAGDVAEGKSLALVGREDGGGSPISGRLRLWSSPDGVARLTDADLAERVRAAWTGGAGDSTYGSSLSGDEVRSVVAYLRTLMGTPDQGVPAADRTAELAANLDRADSLAAAAADAAGAGRTQEARTTAIQAYMAFEGVEPELRTRDAGLVREVERAFADFRGAVAEGAASGELASVQGPLSRAQEVLASPVTAVSLGTQSFIIIVREGFEAILIIGAILAFLVKSGNEQRKRDVYLGVGAALAASVATAFVLQEVLAATPASRELLEGATMLLAVAVLFSVSYWLLSKLEHEKWEAYLRSKMQSALGAGSGLALAGVAFLAVYREGFETVIFYQALMGFTEGGLAPVAAGFGVGCVALAAIYVAFTRFGMKVPMRPFFAVTSGVLYYMAVVFAGSGVRELQEAGLVGTTRLGWAPTVDLLGVYPTAETLAAQGFLLLLLAGALALTFGPSLARRVTGRESARAA